MTEQRTLCGRCSKPKKKDAQEGEQACNCGRPSEYREEYISKVDEYLEVYQDEEEQIVKQSNSEKGYEMYETKLRVKLPTIEGFALYIGVNKDTLYEWEKEYKMFSDALDKIRNEQKERLLNKGLSGDYNSTIAKLVLSSNHGMSDKSEHNLKNDGGKFETASNLSGEQLKEAIRKELDHE